VASELSRWRDPGRIREVARVLTKVKARDAMDIVGYAKEHPRLSAVRCKTRVLGSKDRVRNIEALVIPLEASEYAKLRMIALDMKKEPADIAREWVLDILARK